MNVSITTEAVALATGINEKLNLPHVQTLCQKLIDIWSDLWEPDEREKRKKILETHISETLTTTLDDIFTKEQQTKDEYVLRVEKLLDEIGRFEEALGVSIPYGDVETLPLHCMAKRLNQKAERYRHLVEARISKLEELRSLETSLVEALGALPSNIETSEIPSEQELQTLERHVQCLEAEKKERLVTFMEQKGRIVELFNVLGAKPSLLFEQDVLDDDRSSEFKVTNENMNRLQELLSRMEEQFHLVQERREDVVKTLKGMWEYLEEPQEHQDDILRAYSGFTSQDIAGMQAELERCKKEKSTNIAKFVERIRGDIVKEWDRCMVSEKTRDEFRVFRLTYYNEDIYDLHELELARWKTFYTDNQRIFDLYAQHNQLFNKLIELNGRNKKADRFNNRGGQLLQEEKQRKLVAKELPRVESELRAALNQFVETHGEPFTSFGDPLVEVLNKQWQDNFDQKTIDRFRDGVSACARTPMALKRAGALTPATAPKMSRVATPAPSSTTRPKPPTRCRTELYKPKKEPQQQEPDSTMHLEPSYEDFQKTLKSKLGTSKHVSRSTEVLSPMKLRRERTLLKPANSSPQLTFTAATPKTVPRRNPARPEAVQSRTPGARTRLPIIL